MAKRKDLSIPLIPLALRRINGVKTVSSGAVNRKIPQNEVRETLRRYQNWAASQVPEARKSGKNGMQPLVDGLWKSEGFSTTLGKFLTPENTLNDTGIPRESLGIAHVGFGAASNERVVFDTGKLTEIAETLSEPGFRGFTYEGMGSILRIYEPGIFKFMCGLLGLISLRAPDGPDQTGFFAKFFSAFPEENQRLIVHGYGRLVAFSKLSVYAAIDEAMRLPANRVEPCVQGIAFAFAMMNGEDMPILLENSAISYPDGVRAAFQNGLVYGMIFCEWFVPGFLAGWTPEGRLEEKLIGKARAESELNLKRGYPLAFQLENRLQ
ncbi:MAG: hypothetical protein WD696_22300 [Bryobacteraceae bacterium]